MNIKIDFELLNSANIKELEEKVKKILEQAGEKEAIDRILKDSKLPLFSQLMFGTPQSGDKDKCSSCGLPLGRVMPEDATKDELLCNACYEQEEK